jgi:hypothetical protein
LQWRRPGVILDREFLKLTPPLPLPLPLPLPPPLCSPAASSSLTLSASDLRRYSLESEGIPAGGRALIGILNGDPCTAINIYVGPAF